MVSSKILQDLRILCSSLHSSEREAIPELARKQGAVVLSVVSPVDPPHVLITRRVATAKHTLVRRINPHTPVVLPKWLTSSIVAGKILPYEDFALGVFQGLNICFSGLSVDEKNKLANDIVSRGARHSPALSTKCTHLITVSTDSEKYKFAKAHKIPCLLPAWLEESIAEGYCLDEKKYSIDKQSRSGTNKDSTNIIAASGREESKSLIDPSVCRGTSVSYANDNLSCQQIAEFSSKEKLSSLQHVQSSAVSNEREKEVPLNEGNSVKTSKGTDFLLGIDSLALETCYIWAAKMSKDETAETLQLCRAAGAKRFEDFHPQLTTHILFGSEVDKEDQENAKIYLESRNDIDIVNLEWLRQSAMEGRPLPISSAFSSTILQDGCRVKQHVTTKISSDTLNHSLSAKSNEDHANAISVQRKGAFLNLSSNLPCQQDQVHDNDDQGKYGNQSFDSVPIFDGCYFTLAAIKGTEDEDLAAKMIRSNGGRLFTASFPSESKTFAICPASLSPANVYSLKSTCNDFLSVPEENRFTIYWLECCIESRRIIRPSRASPCLQPLPYPLPLPGMENISVVVSGYDATTREAIFRTIETLGGSVSRDYMSKRDTHLLLPYAKGRKYEHAERMGICPVTADWLIDCVAFGKIQAPDAYHPPLFDKDQSENTAFESQLKNKDTKEISYSACALDPSQIAVTQFASGDLDSLQKSRPLPNDRRSLFEKVIAGPQKNLNSEAKKNHMSFPDSIEATRKPTLIERLRKIREQSRKSSCDEQEQNTRRDKHAFIDQAKEPRLTLQHGVSKPPPFVANSKSIPSKLDLLLEGGNKTDNTSDLRKDSHNISSMKNYGLELQNAMGTNKGHQYQEPSINDAVENVRKQPQDKPNDRIEISDLSGKVLEQGQDGHFRRSPNIAQCTLRTTEDNSNNKNITLAKKQVTEIVGDRNKFHQGNVHNDCNPISETEAADFAAAVDGVKSILEKKNDLGKSNVQASSRSTPQEIILPSSQDMEGMHSGKSWGHIGLRSRKRCERDSDDEEITVHPRRSSRLSSKRFLGANTISNENEEIDILSQKVSYEAAPSKDISTSRSASSNDAIKRRLQRAVNRHQKIQS